MGEYLPFLFAIAYVIYGFYNNLKKAQEEAKKRNPSKPWDAGQAPEREESTWEKEDTSWDKEEWPWQKEASQQPARPSYTEPEPVLVREVHHPASHEPKYESVYQQPAYREYVKPKPAKKQKSSIPTSVTISDRINNLDGAHEVYDFDMRDAVIKKAILDRPQY